MLAAVRAVEPATYAFVVTVFTAFVTWVVADDTVGAASTTAAPAMNTYWGDVATIAAFTPVSAISPACFRAGGTRFHLEIVFVLHGTLAAG